MTLTCERVREVLWPLDRPRNHLPEEEAARAHLAHCGACRSFFLRDAELSRVLQRLGRSIAVSPGTTLRTAVAEALATWRAAEAGASAESGSRGTPDLDVVEPPSTARRRLSGWRSDFAAAAAAVLILGGGFMLAERYDGYRASDKFAVDYVETAVRQVVRPGLDSVRIGRFYERELGRHIIPVFLVSAPVTRATVCDLEGQRGSMIEYDLDGKRLAHYRIPRARGRIDPADADVEVTSRGGVQVVRWVDAQYEHALVADLPADDLYRLASRSFAAGGLEETGNGRRPRRPDID